jgi:hypothetical protein
MTTRRVSTKSGFILMFMIYVILSANASVENKPKIKKIGKDVRDMTDADLEVLLDQWEV